GPLRKRRARGVIARSLIHILQWQLYCSVFACVEQVKSVANQVFNRRRNGMKPVHRFSLSLSICLLLMAPMVVVGQTTGAIPCTVDGTDGRPLPGVTVEASSPSLQGARVSVTGSDGQFR